MEQCYGRSYLSDDEHFLAEEEIKKFCQENGLRFFYYRKLRNNDKPNCREFKLEGPPDLIRQFDDEFCRLKVIENWRKK